MSRLRYTELVRELFPRLTGGIRWGLERTERLLEEVGGPQTRYRTVHVGGTNGKGSVAAMAANALREAGLRTGLYSSPHLCAFRERIRVNGEPITEGALLAAAERVWAGIHREDTTFFEATTVIAFLALAEAGVDIAVIEVGLGGRLDATNVIRPEVSVLTNVSLDHVQLLGSTVDAVAREKAGIIKAGVPVATAERNEIPLGVFRSRAAEVGAALDVVRAEDIRGIRTGVWGTELEVRRRDARWLRVRTSLAGEHQARNAALAIRALDLLPSSLRPGDDAMRAGLLNLRWPGRLQVERLFGRTWVFDVAHNVAGVQALTSALPSLGLPRPIVALIGVLGDKDWRTMLVPLADVADALVFTVPPTSPPERRWDPEAVLSEIAPGGGEVVHDFNSALERAWRLAGGEAEGTVLVTGSFHTVGDALIALGHAPYGADTDLPPPPFAA